MEYLKIKKRTFLEIVISALCGMVISLIVVLYLINQIKTLDNIIKNFNYESHVIIIQKEKQNEEEYEEKRIETKAVKTTNVQTKKITENLTETIENQNDKVYTFNDEEKELLAKLLYCEGRGESIKCQRAILSVVLNRLDNGYWGNTVKQVIYAKGQFSPALDGTLEKAKPTQTQYEVVDYVLKNGSTLPSWVMYFRASYHFNWKGYAPYCAIDNTYFGGMQ